MRVGMLTALTANVYRKKGATPARAIDFMPFIEKPKQTTEQMMRICKAIAAAYSRKAN